MGNLADDFSLSLLSILAMADMKGRICADRDELLEMVELFRLQAEEYGCSDAPFVPKLLFRVRLSFGQKYLSGPKVV